MPFRPSEISREHVLNAIKKIEDEHIEVIPSTRWSVDINGKLYPPKEVMRYAHEQMNGEKIWKYSGGNDTNKFLANLQFDIKDKNNDPVKELIEKYKDHIRNGGLENELYKWTLLKDFAGRPSIEAPDFSAEIRSINFSNLIYPVGISVIHHIAKERPEEYRQCFRELYDETHPLDLRITNFTQKTLLLYRELVPEKNLSHHHDERTIATFLTYRNPDKYSFYKDSFYRKYCKLLGIKSKKKGEKYLHYLELTEDLINEYLKEHSELQELVTNSLTEEHFPDTTHRLLAQDILYQTLDKLSLVEEVIGLMASDSTGWQDDTIEEMEGNEATVIWNSKRPSGTNQTLKFLRNLIEEGNSFNLYYNIGGKIKYKATIIDFAENQGELDLKKWDKKYKTINYHDKFSDYNDGKKYAYILFLASALEEIEPIPVSEFEFYNGYEVPRQDNISPLKSEPEIFAVSFSGKQIPNNPMVKNMSYSLNQILYGPPGTGKTYSTVNRAIEILTSGENVDGLKRADLHELYNRFVESGQVRFVTFHQSMSYEDFVEGIKPVYNQKLHVVEYPFVSGLFKEVCQDALKALYEVNITDVEADYEDDDFDTLYDEFIKEIQTNFKQDEYPFITKDGSELRPDKEELDNGRLITYYRWSSTGTKASPGKTPFPIKKEKIRILYLENVTPNETNITQRLKPLLGYHLSPHYAVYKSFLKFISQKGKTVPDNNQSTSNPLLTNDDEYGKYLDQLLLIQKQSRKLKKGKPYLLIIDEINRGNVSQIFGELITLLEEDKRLGNEEVVVVNLPYSKSSFAVPNNVYIIGTMNTADRSVEALDTALRRRFVFEEVLPHYDLAELDYRYAGVNASQILLTLNKRIEKLLDKDHQIGHSYFILKENEVPERKLITSFYKNIIPLLQEYFFGDYGKIGLILGNGFVRQKEWSKEEDSFADFDYSNSSEFEAKEVYEIMDYRKAGIDYRIIADKAEIPMDFEKAIRILMKLPIA